MRAKLAPNSIEKSFRNNNNNCILEDEIQNRGREIYAMVGGIKNQKDNLVKVFNPHTTTTLSHPPSEAEKKTREYTYTYI